jgi:hypothetical protein
MTAMANMDDADARAAAWLTAWDAQGTHRTGTAGDAEGAAWLAREAKGLGVEPQFEEFGLDRLDPVDARLEIDGQPIPGVPVFDAPATGPNGVAGRLGLADEAEIRVAELSPRDVYSGAFEKLRRDRRQQGLVVVCRGERPGLGLLNAEAFRQPYGAPILHVASETRDIVLAAAARGAPARLVAHSHRVAARACNVVVSVPGREKGLPPLVVMTPRSSWWQSTAERGGGLVCWLESLRALAAAPPGREVILSANSGHELGHLGLDDFLARRPGWEGSTEAGGALWLHYGANIGAVGGSLSLLTTSEEMRAAALVELARAGTQAKIAPKSLVPSGETRDIHRAGGCYLTLVGTNPWFHLPQDRWPHAVDAAPVARIAAAAARLAAALGTLPINLC